MKNLWEYDKFWVIWVSCIDKSRTLQEIQNIWGYRGNSLYQKGNVAQIWKEMIDERFLEHMGRVKYRGVEGVLLRSNFEWVPDFLRYYAEGINYNFKNEVPASIVRCFDEKRLVFFLNRKRREFYEIDKVKTLFGDKETLKNNYELCVTAPLISMIYITTMSTMSREMGKDTSYLLSQALVFFPNFSVNFLDYFRRVSSEVSPEELENVVKNEEVFSLWKRYAERINI